MERFVKILNCMITSIFGILVGYLTVSRLAWYCTIDSFETTHYESDNWFVNILMVLIILSIIIFVRSFVDFNKLKSWLNKYGMHDNRLLRVMFYLMLLVGAWFVISTQLRPKTDQFGVLEIASEFRSKNYDQWKKGGYMAIYPNQNGYVMFIYFISKVFGDFNNIGLQLVNVLAWGMSIGCVRYLTSKNKNAVTILMALFFPLMSYVTFVYGTLVGLASSLISFCFQKKFHESGKAIYSIIAAFLMAVAIILKNNYLIFMIAMTIVLVLSGLKDKQWKNMFMAIMLVLTCLGALTLLNTFVEKKTGGTTSEGMPAVAWIAMGMQEGNRASGWFNAYHDGTFSKNKYDVEEMEKECKEDVESQWKYFKENPGEGLAFYHRKIVSQWNNPNFECFYNQANRQSSIYMGSITKMLITGENAFINWSLKLYHWFILTGTCMSIVLCFKEHDIHDMTFAIMFIGGFLFHILWEAKCQYTIVYFVLLIPYAVEGYQAAAKMLESTILWRFQCKK